MHQAFHAFLDLREAAVVGEVGDLGAHLAAFRIALGDIDPGILAQLLHAQADPVLVPVELEHAHRDFIPHFNHFVGVADATPGHVGDVQQPIHAAQIDEGAVVGEVLDHALQIQALFQGGQQRLPLLAIFLFQHRAPGDHHVVALLIELDDIEFQGPAFQMGGFPQGPDIDQGTGQEGADVAKIHGEAPLDLAADDASDRIAAAVGLLQHQPGFGAAGLLPGQAGFPFAVIHDLHRHLDLIPDFQIESAGFIHELAFGNEAFRFQAGMHDHAVAADLHHGAGDDGAGRHLQRFHALLEQFREIFSHVLLKPYG